MADDPSVLAGDLQGQHRPKHRVFCPVLWVTGPTLFPRMPVRIHIRHKARLTMTVLASGPYVLYTVRGKVACFSVASAECQ